MNGRGFEAAPRRVKVIRPPSLSPAGLLGGLKTLWEYGDLLRAFSVHRIRVRYKQSALGLAWAIVQPLSLMLIYTLVFSVIARVPSGGTPYAVFAFSAIATFVLLKVTDVIVGLRVAEDEEREGLDVTQHGERIA